MNKTRQVWIWSVTVALGGFLFGFDTAVISGAEQAIQHVWQLSDFEHGLAVAIALYGTVLGALVGGIPADRFGRKKTLFWIAALYLISALGSAIAPDLYTFMIFRLLGGLGVGASSVVAPMYISEIAPASRRGKLVALFQFNIVLGIVIAYLSNYLLAGVNESAWRWMLGIEAVPALVFLLAVLQVPRSPRWLITRHNNIEEARQVFETIDPETAEIELDNIRSAKAVRSPGLLFFLTATQYRRPLMLAFLFALFNQLSGINAIIYYAPRIFNLTGLGTSSSLLSTAGMGLVNLVFTLLGMFLIDKLGRKTLMYFGSVGLLVSLSIISYAFYAEQFAIVPAAIFGFIAFFALSQGAVIWVFISEIFPNEVRALGVSLGAFTHWLLAAIVANVFPYFVTNYDPAFIFICFSLMMLLQLIYVWLMMPETKGRSLEAMNTEKVPIGLTG